MSIPDPFHAVAKEGVLHLEARTPLVAAYVAAQRDFLKAQLDRAERAVVLDLTCAELVDSLGVTLIVGLFKSCRERQLGFSVVGANTEVLRLFHFFSLNDCFEIMGK